MRKKSKSVGSKICYAALFTVIFYIFSFGQGVEKKTVGVCNVATNLLPIEVESTSPKLSVAYPNLGEAFYAINKGKQKGDIVVEVCFDSNEPEEAVLNSNKISPADYTSLTIRPLKDNLTISATTGFNALVALNGTDYVTIDGDNPNSVGTNRNLTIRGWGGRSIICVRTHFVATRNYHDGANNNTLKNLNIFGYATPSYGIALGGFNPDSSGRDNDHNEIRNCAFRNVRTGIYSSGDEWGRYNIGTIITKNDLSATGDDRVTLVGIEAAYEDQAQITENIIGGLENGFGEIEMEAGIKLGVGKMTDTHFSTTTALGRLNVPGSVSNTLVARNTIKGIVGGKRQSVAGIFIVGFHEGVNRIENNFISGVIGDGIAPNLIAGIFVAGIEDSRFQIYNNSISMAGDRGSTGIHNPSFAATFIGTDVSIELINNIFSNTQTSDGGLNGKSYAIGYAVKTSLEKKLYADSLKSENNLFFTSGKSAGLFRISSFLRREGIDLDSLSEWQKASNNDASSLLANPLFINQVNDLHLQPKSPAQNAGKFIDKLVFDIDGNSRPTTKNLFDIGADETETIN